MPSCTSWELFLRAFQQNNSQIFTCVRTTDSRKSHDFSHSFFPFSYNFFFFHFCIVYNLWVCYFHRCIKYFRQTLAAHHQLNANDFVNETKCVNSREPLSFVGSFGWMSSSWNKKSAENRAYDELFSGFIDICSFIDRMNSAKQIETYLTHVYYSDIPVFRRNMVGQKEIERKGGKKVNGRYDEAKSDRQTKVRCRRDNGHRYYKSTRSKHTRTDTRRWTSERTRRCQSQLTQNATNLLSSHGARHTR